MAESTSKLVNRSDKVAFWKVGDTYHRMKGFTEFSGSKNPIEYSRKYVDEQFEQTDVTGYSPSWSFAFDDYTNDPVLTDIKDLFDNEKIGTDAVREIVFVDFSTLNGTTCDATKRSFSVIADSEGDGDNAYTYGGTLKVKSSMEKGTATITGEFASTEEVMEVSFTKAS